MKLNLEIVIKSEYVNDELNTITVTSSSNSKIGEILTLMELAKNQINRTIEFEFEKRASNNTSGDDNKLIDDITEMSLNDLMNSNNLS